MSSSPGISALAAIRGRLPVNIVCAIAALIAAWIISAAALSINQLLFHGSGIGPGPLIGIVSLGLQAAMIALVARGHAVGRGLALLFFVLAALPLPMVERLVAERAIFSAAYLVSGFVLKGAATVLLFTGDSRRWFAARDSLVIR